MRQRKIIKVPAKQGDVVLLTPGALSDPNGRIHWWKFVMDFGRPDGTRGISDWLVASHKYAARHNFDPETFQIIGDVVWENRFVSPDGGIDADVFLGFAQGERERMNPLNKNGLMIAGGVAVLGAIGIAIYSATSKAATSPSSSGGAIVTTTPNAPTGVVNVGTIHSLVTVTPANAGQQLTMNVGDELDVILPTSSTVAGYTPSVTAILNGTTTSSANGQVTMTYIAASTGTTTLSFQPIDINGNSAGSPISYTIVIG
jgi:hypothetical protein